MADFLRKFYNIDRVGKLQTAFTIIVQGCNGGFGSMIIYLDLSANANFTANEAAPGLWIGVRMNSRIYRATALFAAEESCE